MEIAGFAIRNAEAIGKVGMRSSQSSAPHWELGSFEVGQRRLQIKFEGETFTTVGSRRGKDKKEKANSFRACIRY